MIELARKSSKLAMLAAVLTLALGSQVRADSAAVTLTPDPSNTFNNGGAGSGYSLGWEFTVGGSANITVTQLGYFSNFGTALTETHDVGIYDTSMNLLTSTTVLTTDPVSNLFAYHAIAPVTLSAGGTYWIMGTSGTVDPYTFTPTAFSTDPRITYNFDGFTVGGSLAFPSIQNDGTIQAYFGPNFMIGSGSVPEPSSLVLGTLAIAGVALVGLRRRWSRTAA
jgi:hypothetical protein